MAQEAILFNQENSKKKKKVKKKEANINFTPEAVVTVGTHFFSLFPLFSLILPHTTVKQLNITILQEKKSKYTRIVSIHPQ